MVLHTHPPPPYPQPPPPPTHTPAGSRDEALSEAVFLLELHQNRTQNATQTANISALQPVPWDASGSFLTQLRQWRQQRLSAIDWELSRLLTEWGISRQEVQELLLEQQQQQQEEEGGAGAGVLGGAGGAGQYRVVDGRFSSNSSDPWQRMLDWMRHNGAVVSVCLLPPAASLGPRRHPTPPRLTPPQRPTPTPLGGLTLTASLTALFDFLSCLTFFV